MGEASERLLRTVRQTIERHGLLDAPGLSPRVIVAAVSGGPDSLCLLHVLLALRSLHADYELEVHAAHLNHGLRGADSDEDARFVEKIAAAWGVPLTVGAADVMALVRAEKLSVEEAARHARYAFLARVAAAVSADRIALGHNADDQTETALMHWLRGAGLAGLRGMAPKSLLAELRFEMDADDRFGRPRGAALTDADDRIGRPHRAAPTDADDQTGRAQPDGETGGVWLIRPLLHVTRAEIEAYCRENGLSPRSDLSNWDTTYFRNRLRHELLPYLEAYNPNIRATIRRSAQALAGDYDVVRERADTAWRETLRSAAPGRLTLDLAAWRALPIGLQRSTVRMAVERLRRHLRDLGWEHVESAVWLARTRETGTRATLPAGLCLTVGYDTLTVADGAGTLENEPECPWLAAGSGETADAVALRLPGVTPLPGSPWRVEATWLDAGEDVLRQAAVNPDPNAAYLDADRAAALWLRPRKAGDRFQPLGLRGRSKSVREFMINEKIPAAWRDRIPLCVTGGDAIAWIVGWRVDERFKVHAGARRMLRLCCRRDEWVQAEPTVEES
jgi:tRNA(Ile)-lysidine synthetase-like protein